MTNIETLKAAGQVSQATAISGTDDDGNPANFCVVDATAKANIEAWLTSTGSESSFQPIFIRYSKAEKALTSTLYPTLGIDTTLPQYRPDTISAEPNSPAQNKYPVLYFFYGTLAEPDMLKRLWGVDPMYRPARVTGGALTTWGGKYKALVDSPGSKVDGSAFMVENVAHEDALRCYETEKYEVVRCAMEMMDDGTMVKGLTFRFRS